MLAFEDWLACGEDENKRVGFILNAIAEHDDAPDSAASIVRAMWNKRDNSGYQSILR